MEVQIASTLKVLSDSINDKKVQAHGLKFLVECGNSQLDEDKIRDLPIIEVVLSSIQHNSTVKTVLKLGCSVLITYSRFSFCVEAAYKCNLIEHMCSQIVRLASESILSLDLAVVAAYGMAEHEKSEQLYKLIMETLQSIEGRWVENEVVMQQIITNYIVVSECICIHPHLLQTAVFSNFEHFLNTFIHNEYIAFGLISSCKGLVLSDEGRKYLCAIDWCGIVLPVIVKYPSNIELCGCCLSILLKLNMDAVSRKSLLQQDCLSLLITITNYCQKDEAIIQQATQVIRSISSAEQESLELVVQSNTISCLVMCLMSHPKNVIICTHGSRALEWIVKAGGARVSKLLIDEGVVDLCIDILENHDDIDLVNSVSFLLIKIIRASKFDDYCTSHICETTLFSVLKERLVQQEKNESIIVSYCNVIGILVSNKLCSSLLLDNQICETICHLLHSMILDSSVVLLTGILWKFSLLMEGRDQLVRCGGVDVLIGKIQLYPTHSTIQRNCAGCLFNLSNQYKEISELLMSRLAVSLLVDSLQDNRADDQCVLQVVPLLQNLFRNAKCKAFLLQHNIVNHVLDALTEHLKNTVIVQICLLFLNVIGCDKQGIVALTQSAPLLSLLQEIQKLYNPATTNMGTIAQGLCERITKMKETLFFDYRVC